MAQSGCDVTSAISLLLERMRASGKSAPAIEILRQATVRKQLVQDYRPVAESLEWQLARIVWYSKGVLPFIENSVPFLVNNDGRLSVDAAAVLFANCEEAAPTQESIRVLELGAGTGLFARYFLNEFRDLCRRASRDYYARLTYHVTDGFPRTVEQWRECGIFQEHAAVVFPSVLQATEAGAAGPVRAVFCNYVLDSLPAAFLRKAAGGWQQLWVRTWIAEDSALLRQFTRLTPDELRARAASTEPEALRDLLPLLPLLECDTEFLPLDDDAPPGLAELERECGGAPFAYNYGAIQCLQSLEPALEGCGFMLINDYGPADPRDASGFAPGQRFGPVVAAGLNFPLIEAFAHRRGLICWKPEGDGARRLHARVFSRSGLTATRRAFESRFAATALEQTEAPAQRARQQAAAGFSVQALASYREALERNPWNWQVMGEVAAFITAGLNDPHTGFELARAAIELNPWYSPSLWNVLGDCLAALERVEDAYGCYLQAYRMHPANPETNLRMAGSWLRMGDPQKSLEAVARGLANDSNASFRHALLYQQQQTMNALSARWNAESATAARRSGIRVEDSVSSTAL